MSGIYIPGVENLKCNDCFWAIGYRLKCSCSSEQANYDMGERPKDCPLVPIPDHGRLIDADELYESCALDSCIDVMASTKRINEYMQLKIDDAPTIIPADKEGEE